MVGRMFAIITMSCWGERFTEVGTESRLLDVIPWCEMVAYSATWEAIAMAVA